MARKPADKVGIIVRFTEALRRRIERGAKANHRSMNSEIVARLEAAYLEEDRQASASEWLLKMQRERSPLLYPSPDQREAAGRELAREIHKRLAPESPFPGDEEEKK
jgi:Arc-like DNA binding domain